MSTSRRNRLPVSCEPCRARKIGCPRDGSPCGTCVRRRIRPALCTYATKTIRLDQRTDGPVPGSMPQDSSSDLASRVAKLERLLQQQQQQNPSPDSEILSPELPEGHRVDTGASNDAENISHGPMNKQCIGHLETSASGHVRYMPFGASWNTGRPTRHQPNQHAAYTLDTTHWPLPLDRASDKIIDEVFALLPSKTFCAKIKDVFFKSFAPLFHVLHDPTFHSQYHQFEQEPQKTPLAWLALLFAVLGTATLALDRHDDILSELSWRPSRRQKMAELAERYRPASMRCLEADGYLWRQNVTTLQALIILIYGINHSYGQAWSLLGLTHHIALSIGCHIDPSNFDLSSIECEERRRCWAALTMLYTIQNTSMGNLWPSHHLSDYPVQLPADINDEDIGIGGLPTPGCATQMSYLLLKFRIYEIASAICTKVLKVPVPEARTVQQLDQKIGQEQKLYEDTYFVHSESQTLSLQHAAHFNILYGYSYQLLLLLHKPLLFNYEHTSERQRQARARCIQSAKGILEIHRLFHESEDFAPYCWYHRGLGSFHAFHAAVNLVAIGLSDPDSYDLLNVASTVRACIERFEGMAEASMICAKAVPFLRSLLNLVVTGISSQPTPPTEPAQNAETMASFDPNIQPITTADSTSLHPESLDWLIGQLNPQSWISPSALPWTQWDNDISNATLEYGQIQ